LLLLVHILCAAAVGEEKREIIRMKSFSMAMKKGNFKFEFHVFDNFMAEIADCVWSQGEISQHQF
jgi:hypothetical protein